MKLTLKIGRGAQLAFPVGNPIGEAKKQPLLYTKEGGGRQQ